ncbi:MAG: FxsA family protein [Acidobacteriota bacterium]
MLLRLFLLFTLIPMVELYLLIRLGARLGVLDTLAIVIITGMMGGLLARSQGLAVLNRIRMELDEGRIPTESLFDGVMILVAGVLLITPGLLTDGLGLCLLIPWTRQGLKVWLKQKVQQKVSKGETVIEVNSRAIE